jgi:hypothetical protein
MRSEGLAYHLLYQQNFCSSIKRQCLREISEMTLLPLVWINTFCKYCIYQHLLTLGVFTDVTADVATYLSIANVMAVFHGERI